MDTNQKEFLIKFEDHRFSVRRGILIFHTICIGNRMISSARARRRNAICSL